MTKTVKFVSIQQVGRSYNGGLYFNNLFGTFEIIKYHDGYGIYLEFGTNHKNYYNRVYDFIAKELIKAVENNFCWQLQNIMLYLIQQI